MAGRDENDGRRDRRRHLRPVRGARPPEARTALPAARGERPLRRGDPHRDGGRLPARSRPRLDAGAEAAGHRAVPRARPRRAPRPDQPRAAEGLRAPPARAACASGRNAARGSHPGAADAAQPALLLARQAAHGPRSRAPRPRRARRRVDRVVPAPPLRAGGRRPPGRAAPRGHPRGRPGAALDPRHLPAPARARKDARQPRARDAARAQAAARARQLRRPSTRCAAVWRSW